MKFIFLSVMFWGLVCCPAGLQAEEPLPVLKGIRVFRVGADLGVEVRADKNLEYGCSKMPQLLRVVINLPRTEPGIPDTVYRYKDALISAVRVEKKSINDVQITRVSVDLAQDANYTIRDDSDKTKVTLIFHKAAPGSAAGTAAARPASSAQAQPAATTAAAQNGPAPNAVPTPAMAPADQPVAVTGVYSDAGSIEIKSNGAINQFKAFTLQQPGRLVIDIPGAQTTLRSIALPANGFGVSKARTGIFEGKLRLVFESGSKPFPAYDVVKTGTGLRVVSRPPAL